MVCPLGFGLRPAPQSARMVAEARDYLARALEIFERLGTLIETDKLRAELAELPSV
jgi:hypothetical protein